MKLLLRNELAGAIVLEFFNQISYHYFSNDRGNDMLAVVTINRPDVVALIETAANRLTNGNKTEAVALAMRRLLDLDARSLFGAHRGSVRVREGVDLTDPMDLDITDAESGKEIDR